MHIKQSHSWTHVARGSIFGVFISILIFPIPTSATSASEVSSMASLDISSNVLAGGFSNKIAWGDVDGDGDLDLAVGTGTVPNRIHLNQNGTLERVASWSSDEVDSTGSIAWGDVDGDGDLDLAAGNGSAPNRIYLNANGVLETSASWSSDEEDGTTSIAWGDVDGDGDLDLAAGNDGVNRIYLNMGGVLETTASWASSEADDTADIAWGDVDGDGDIDLAVGNHPPLRAGQKNRIYLNENGTLETAASWSSDEIDNTDSISWGDADNDGDLDLAVGNRFEANRIYLNESGTLETSASWSSDEVNSTQSVAWGDVDGDGDADLAVGNYDIGDKSRNRVHLQENGGVETSASWFSADSIFTNSVAWGDVDNDGDLDLAAGYYNDSPNFWPNRIYYNQDGVLNAEGLVIDAVPTSLDRAADPESLQPQLYLPFLTNGSS